MRTIFVVVILCFVIQFCGSTEREDDLDSASTFQIADYGTSVLTTSSRKFLPFVNPVLISATHQFLSPHSYRNRYRPSATEEFGLYYNHPLVYPYPSATNTRTQQRPQQSPPPPWFPYSTPAPPDPPLTPQEMAEINYYTRLDLPRLHDSHSEYPTPFPQVTPSMTPPSYVHYTVPPRVRVQPRATARPKYYVTTVRTLPPSTKQSTLPSTTTRRTTTLLYPTRTTKRLTTTRRTTLRTPSTTTTTPTTTIKPTTKLSTTRTTISDKVDIGRSFSVFSLPTLPTNTPRVTSPTTPSHQDLWENFDGFYGVDPRILLQAQPPPVAIPNNNIGQSSSVVVNRGRSGNSANVSVTSTSSAAAKPSVKSGQTPVPPLLVGAVCAGAMLLAVIGTAAVRWRRTIVRKRDREKRRKAAAINRAERNSALGTASTHKLGSWFVGRSRPNNPLTPAFPTPAPSSLRHAALLVDGASASMRHLASLRRQPRASKPPVNHSIEEESEDENNGFPSSLFDHITSESPSLTNNRVDGLPSATVAEAGSMSDSNNEQQSGSSSVSESPLNGASYLGSPQVIFWSHNDDRLI